MARSLFAIRDDLGGEYIARKGTNMPHAKKNMDIHWRQDTEYRYALCGTKAGPHATRRLSKITCQACWTLLQPRIRFSGPDWWVLDMRKDT